MNYIVENEILQDTKKNGDQQPWVSKKNNSLKTSLSFRRLDFHNRATKIQFCGSELMFGECISDNYTKLLNANFCKDRLCPMCNWRRSNMLRGQILDILHVSQENQKMKYIFITLTIRNCYSDDLSMTIDKLYKGFNRLMKYKKVDNIIVGWFRCLEVTFNNNRRSKSYNTYHAHFHMLIGVPIDYVKGDDYISQEHWTSLWQKALCIDYKPIVDVRMVKPKHDGQTFESAVLETAKYTVKESDYLFDNYKDTDKVILVLSSALKNRRLIGYGKLFKKVKSDLHLKDIESCDSDLVGENKKECKCIICGSALIENLYRWNMGFKNYIKDKEEK